MPATPRYRDAKPSTTSRRYQPTYADALKMARHQVLEMGLDLDVPEFYELSHAIADAWFYAVPGSVFRKAWEAQR